MSFCSVLCSLCSIVDVTSDMSFEEMLSAMN